MIAGVEQSQVARWAGLVADYQPAPAFVVHVKPDHLHMYDAGKKPVACIVRGWRKYIGDVELLVEIPTVVERHGSSFRFCPVRPDQTAEGYRFTRVVTKAIKTIATLGREGAKAIARQGREREATERKARGATGTCQVCAGEHVVRDGKGRKAGKIVLHGYQRPGWGYTVGSCYGVDALPFELDCSVLKQWIVELGHLRDGRRASLFNLDTLTEITVERTVGSFRKSRTEYKTITRATDPSGFESAITRRRWQLEGELRSIESDIVHQRARLAGWKPVAS